MASPTRAVRLRIPNYQPFDTDPDAVITGKDLILRLKVSRIQKEMSDGAQALVFPFFEGTIVSYEMVRMIITLTGSVLEDGAHGAHPVIDAVEHDPDFIDLEETVVLWNNRVRPADKTPANLNLFPQLEIDTVDGFRIYKGAISKLELTRREGKEQVDFVLQFAVAWSEDSPPLREWGT